MGFNFVIFAFSMSLLGTLLSSEVRALPLAQQSFCELYGDSLFCRDGKVPDCSVCHTSAPNLNSYGECIKKAQNGQPLGDSARNAMMDVQNLDCDGDSFVNLQEILSGKLPGDSNSKPDSGNSPQPMPPTGDDGCDERNRQSDWNVCGYDADYVFRKMHQDFCGYSPTFEDLEAFRQLSESGKVEKIQASLASCFDTDYWQGRDGVLWKMAHRKINPLQTLKSGEDKGEIALGDYYDDYNLFVYHYIDGHDARGLLTADYFVVRTDNPTTYRTVDNVPAHPQMAGVVKLLAPMFGNVQQLVPKDKRAGMLTTMWNSNMKTMFTNLPRTTAASAIRSYLNLDMAKLEGLIPPSDPNYKLVDYDNKGVAKDGCSFCHSVLDPAAYAFSKYNGLSFMLPNNPNPDVGAVFTDKGDQGFETVARIIGIVPPSLVQNVINNTNILIPGIYHERRMGALGTKFKDTEPQLGQVPESGFLLGKPVANLREWAQVAANSDEFAKAIVHDFWSLLMGQAPTPKDQEEFDSLWQRFRNENNYSVEAMLQEFVKTEAYGAP